MTEVVDKTLIERLILEHSDRLELEINQKARADAWKFYYRVRVDHVIRPFAVCKVCFRVLHCDSRSGTASLLRHPCNPLSERSPVNRAVKLTAKLNLPRDGINHKKIEAYKNEYLKDEPTAATPILHDSPISLIGGVPTTSCPSPTNTGSPPTATQPSISASITAHINNNNSNGATNNNNNRKRKVGSVPAPVFPLDLRLLHLPQMMAAVAAAHPLAALNLANATGMLSDPQHLQQLQQQHSQLEHLIREHHQNLQQERELKRNREEDNNIYHHDRTAGSPGEASSSSSPNWGRPRVKKERADTSEEAIGNSEDHKETALFNGNKSRSGRSDDILLHDEFSNSTTKEVVQHLVNLCSPRVAFADKDSGGSHYISDVWTRFQMVYIDGVLRPFAACKLCRKVVTYTKYSGTGGLLRHRCSNQDARHFESNATHETFMDLHAGETSSSPMSSGDSHDLSSRVEIPPYTSSPRHSSREGDNGHLIRPADESSATPTAPMAGVARALLRYMCQDFVSATTLDSPAFHQLVWTVLNLGAAHGTLRQEEPLPSSKQLLNLFLQPLVSDSKEVIGRSLQDQTYLCLSTHQRQAEDGENLLAAAIHCITKNFELQTHAIGTKKVYKGDSREEAVSGLVREFFDDKLPPSTIREKYVTVVSDDGELYDMGSASVRCLWHSVESVLENLTEVSAYALICDEVRSVLTRLAETGVDGVGSCGLRASEVHRWEPLLHAITFVIRHFNELQTVLSDSSGQQHNVLTDREIYEEVKDLLVGVQMCLMTVRDAKRPTLNQAVLCRAKLLQLCSSPATSSVTHQLKEFLGRRIEKELCLAPLHLVASFLDPRCKSLKVLSETEKNEVHRLVLEMMKAVSVTEANAGVLNLKTTRRSSSSPPPLGCPAAARNSNAMTAHPRTAEADQTSSSSSASAADQETRHPFREYMDNPSSADLSVSDGEEIMAYVNMKVQWEDDDILRWWAGPAASGLPTLRRLARKILAVPATCAYACQMTAHAMAVSEKMGIADHCHMNNVMHMKYNIN